MAAPPSMDLTVCDLERAPGILDQTLLFQNIMTPLNQNGDLQFRPVSSNQNGVILPGTVLIDKKGMSNISQIQVGQFYIPKNPAWDNNLLKYSNRIFLQIGEVNNNGFYGYQPALSTSTNALYNPFLNNVTAFQYQFAFDMTDVGDRYLLTPVFDTINFKNLINLNQTITLIFNTSLYKLQLPNPYQVCDVIYYPSGGGYYSPVFTPVLLGAGSINVSASVGSDVPTPVTFTNENYVMILNEVNGFVPLVPYIINITGQYTFVIDVPPIQSASPIPPTRAIVLNVSWLVNIPMRVRQIEKLALSSNRLLPVAT